ncbi:MAG: hypothetical protein KA436_05815 [Oligoflexales bacterium]|nr:hypothetical protein [Oligoflexales bacterium]
MLPQNLFEHLELPPRYKPINPYVQTYVENQTKRHLPIVHGSDLKTFPGLWREKAFSEKNRKIDKLVLEIGSHNGKTFCEMAGQHPDTGFVGMDITFKRIVSTAEKVASLSLSNASLILADARVVPQIFHPGELDGVIAFFPDPWTKKKKQAHKRLFTDAYCQNLSLLLRKTGFFWFRTDSELYYEEVCSFMKGLNWPKELRTLEEETVHNPWGDSLTYESSFHARFKEQGQSIFQGLWRKREGVIW